jgi:hypothetical protein
MLQAAMSSDDLRTAIYEQLDLLRSGSLCFWGVWFGKPYDNIHRIVGADSSGDTAVIYFDHAESLTIDAPKNWSLDAGSLLIRRADRVRLQWFYYGRLPSRETLQFEEYRWAEGLVEFTTDFQPGRRPELDQNAPAVQLHSFG